MRLVHTDRGVGRIDGDDVVLLDAPSILDAWDARETGRVPRPELTLLAPVPRPGKIVAIALNYRRHAEETGAALPTEPLPFTCPSTAVVADGTPIVLPSHNADKVDYEGEVALVMGRRASKVKAADAWGHVLGVTICNDVSARDVQRSRPSNFAVAKSYDSFKPLGPVVVTVDEYEDPDDIGVRTWVNGDLRQDSRTTDLIFQVPELIEFITRSMTLEPGDVISTGTPEGVGDARGTYLRPGDVVEIEVDLAGRLRNEVVAG